ncbi:MAG: TonB-dependent receptor [Lunatimonas sp.]|uniref:SusC/RagA family TonB-linked outer membrane protein n=1 Tax=Lunatimonas sp. TaxID=2060141 RepID=UPI00263BB86D|nr:TonB-dependent receptor [Lunatimonas sp.]MCC5938369.1 TonB-dependent receptor [Lunatimonas sp.]
MKKIILLFNCILWIHFWSFGQNEISGRVVSSEDKQPLPGVSIMVKETGNGVVTDTNGTFRLNVPNAGRTLVFSFIGMATQEVSIGNQTVFEITMREEQGRLDEVVVIGYGTMDRKRLASAVSSISSDEIEKDPLPSLTQAIQGKAGGVQVTQNSGTPGGGISIRVRGTTSINASSEPLYVIDGVPVNSSTNFIGGQDFNFGGADQGINILASINPSDIASIEILKDAAATAIYGARASNGVVLVTTKRGRANESRVSINAYAGFSEVPRERWLNFMNSEEYVDYIQDLWSFRPQGGSPHPAILDTSVDTDWQRETFQTAAIQNYEVSATGGSDKTQYYTSFGYYNQEGTIKNSGFHRYSFRLNLDHQHSDRLQFNANVNLTSALNRRIQEENSRSAPIRNGLVTPPTIPVRDASGNWAFDPQVTSRENPVAWLTLPTNTAENLRILTNVGATYRITDDLSFKTNFGVDLSTIEENFFLPPNGVIFNQGIGLGGSRISKDQLFLNENFLQYQKQINETNRVDAILGMSLQESRFSFTDARRTNFPFNEIPIISAGGIISGANAGVQEWSIVSYFSRVNYSLHDKYLLTANYRVDGSSRFGALNRYGHFPSVAFAWRLGDEDFLRGNNVVENLKLRTSWGLSGNQEIPNYVNQILYSGGQVYNQQPGFLPNVYGSGELGWETTEQYNFGVDFSLFNNRINVLADYYVKNTRDLLIRVQIPRTSGYQNTFTNLGEIQNRGFEFELKSRNLTGEFVWNTSLNMTFNRNEVMALPEGDLLGGIGNFNIAREGLPLGSFFGWVMHGVNPESGLIDFERNDGTLGPPTRQEDRQIIGNPNPRLFGGITNNFFYKNFDFSVMGQFVGGVELYNYTAFYRFSGFNLSGNGDQAWTRRWRQPGDITDVPRPSPGSLDNAAVSTRWVEDGSFFRIRNITLGYTLPNTLTDRLKISNMRIYTTVQNAFVFTSYTGYDPEVNAMSSDGIAYGTDHSNYPQPRIFTGGINITF